MDRSHWSFSSINQYLRCPLQFYFERVIKLPRATVSSGLVFGSAVHHALAEYHLRLQHREPTKSNEVHEAFLDCWVVRENELQIEFKSSESREDLVEKGIALLDVYLAEEPPTDIVAVEQRTLVPIQNSDGDFLETPLVAVSDLVSKQDGDLKITEFKTSGRAYGQFEVENSLQATCYVNAAWQTFGEWATVEFAILVKTKTPKLQRLPTARHEEDLGRLGDLVENVERAVNAGIFYPVETPMNCATCPFRQPCREWKPDQRPDGITPSMELHGVAIC